MPTQYLAIALAALICSLLPGCANTPGQPGDQPKRAHASGPHWQPKPEVYENHAVHPDDPVQVRTGRYSYIAAKPTAEQLNPLLTLVDIEIPNTINTVGESAKYLLQYSGYTLTQTHRPDDEERILLLRPIPLVHRHFQHVVLRDALLALGGNGFRLLVDPVNRLVAYERDPKYPGWTTP